MQLDEVLLMVTGRAPHKQIEEDPGAEVRLEMARLAAEGEEGVAASDLEVRRDEISYSYRTLELLADQKPGSELYFLLGADMAAGLASWKEPRRVLELARLGVVPRPGVEMDDVRAALERAGCRRSGGDNRDATLRSVLDHSQAAGSSGNAAAAPRAGRGDRADRGAGAVPMSRGKEMAPEELARRLAAIADDKKATDLVALEVRSLVSYTDYLVICTARNERQAKAIHDEVYHQLKRDGWLPARVEGEREAEWVLMDYLDAVLHIFTPELRERYRLEVLWGEAERLDLDLAGARGAA